MRELTRPVQFGSYLLTAHLGQGGMADVYLAEAGGYGGFRRTVVIKRIRESNNANPEFIKMFINEAKLAARMMHPNIVQVYDLGRVDGELFMALEHVNGRDLHEIVRAHTDAFGQRGGLPPLVAAYIACEAFRGLQHAHERVLENGTPSPIVHRDISPHNIMIGFDGRVKLLDFGIAKARELAAEQTHAGVLKGKIAYLAPEQLDGLPADPLTDLFALGIVLHEMLTCRRLFRGETDFESAARVKSRPIPPPSALAPAISRELDAITLRLLERDRSRRYSRAAQVVHDLDALLGRSRFLASEVATFVSSLACEDAVELPALAALGEEPTVISRRPLPTLAPIKLPGVRDWSARATTQQSPPPIAPASTPAPPPAPLVRQRRWSLVIGFALGVAGSIAALCLPMTSRTRVSAPPPSVQSAPLPPPPVPAPPTAVVAPRDSLATRRHTSRRHASSLR